MRGALETIAAQIGSVIARIQAEESLRMSQENLQSLFDTVNDFLFILSSDGRIIHTNPVVQKRLGYSAEELACMTFLEVHPPDLRKEAEAIIADTMAGKTSVFSVPLMTKYGELIPVEAKFARGQWDGQDVLFGISRDITDHKRVEKPLRESEEKYRTIAQRIVQSSTMGMHMYPLTASVSAVAVKADAPESDEVLYFDGIIEEITERKQAEEELRASEEKYRLVVENANEAIIVAQDGVLKFVNPKTLELTGYSEDELTSRPFTDFIYSNDREIVMGRYLKRLEGKEPSHVYPFRIIDKDGNIKWVEINAVLINWQGRPATLNFLADITERKHMETALEEERASLARRIEERTAELRTANAELARANRLKDKFLASMSHELRTPLNVILSISEALQEEVYGPLSKEQVRFLQSIEKSGRHLLDMINDVLDVSKIEAGRLGLDIGPVSVRSVCQASMQFIAREAQRKRIRVSSNLNSDVNSLQADGRRLKQILVNLLDNAIKFTHEDGEIGLEVIGDPKGKAVHFTVWDTGIGISQEQMKHLFQPFVQLDSSLSRQYSGTGLGLALVRSLTDMHGGSVSVKSEPGKGSRFTVSLPWYETVEAIEKIEKAELAEPGAIDIRSIRQVLIIENSIAKIEQVARHLTELGIELTIHDRGEGALARALEVMPDVIILGVPLPDISSWAVLAQLKEELHTQDIPVIIISDVNNQPRGQMPEAVEYLVEPISRQRFQQALGRIAQAGKTGFAPPTATVYEETPTRQSLILLAEDNEENINTFSSYLLVKGYKVSEARDGKEAVECAREHKPDLILMDIQMPGMDGLEAIRCIRADPDLVDIPIIALTALAMSGDRERCLQAGANDYISKPVGLKHLIGAIEAQISRNQT